MNNYCVYKHTSPSGKVYVGITKLKPKYRWNNGIILDGIILLNLKERCLKVEKVFFQE